MVGREVTLRFREFFDVSPTQYRVALRPRIVGAAAGSAQDA
jgi:hypothetical protein